MQYKDEGLNTNCLTVYEASIILRRKLGPTPQHSIKRKIEKQINVSFKMQGDSPLTSSAQLDQRSVG